jgi:hypothetical protein
MRVAYQGVIYRKVNRSISEKRLIRILVSVQILRLSASSLHQYGTGKITNVFSNDASQIEIALDSTHYILVGCMNKLANRLASPSIS